MILTTKRRFTAKNSTCEYVTKVFRHFDPLTGEAPELYHTRCQPILNQARALLVEVPRATIFAILRELSRITSATEAALGADSNQPAYIAHALTLKEQFQLRASDKLAASEYAPHYYAVIALTLIGYIHLVYSGRMHALNKSTYDGYIEQVCEEAEHCVAIAETLMISDSFELLPELKEAC